jgi:uncharacterized membrane protein YidH (DUF202 family)
MPKLEMKLVLLWLTVCLLIDLCARATSRFDPQKFACSFWRAARCALVALPIALCFGPTILVIGWVGLPAPAGLVLTYCAFDSEFRNNNNELIRKNLGLAMISFTGFWLIAGLVSLIRLSRRMQKQATDLEISPTKDALIFISIALVLFIGIVYYFGYCYAHPPKGVPVYEGP